MSHNEVDTTVDEVSRYTTKDSMVLKDMTIKTIYLSIASG